MTSEAIREPKSVKEIAEDAVRPLDQALADASPPLKAEIVRRLIGIVATYSLGELVPDREVYRYGEGVDDDPFFNTGPDVKGQD